MTSVGGTSLETYNPGTNPTPRYPQGTETVWNVDNLCSNAAPATRTARRASSGARRPARAAADQASTGAARSTSTVPASTTRTRTYGNGTHALLAGHARARRAGRSRTSRPTPTSSRRTPSTAPATQRRPYSVCATFGVIEAVPGWFGIGGTSLSSPLWAAIIADRDSYQGHRTGNINPLLYLLFNLAPELYFHDITGDRPAQQRNNNGLFPTTPGYDMATGIGTPKIAALITGPA